MDGATVTEEQQARRFVTVPNILSVLRLLSVPVFIGLWAAGHEGPAVILFGVSATTDFFDGYIARRTNSVTEIGKLLDPLADRVFIVALAVVLVVRDVLPIWVAGAVVARDVLILGLWPVVEKKGISRIRVNFVGKVATACLLFGLPLMALSETGFVWADESEATGLGFAIAGTILYWIAGGLYAREAVGGLRSVAQSRAGRPRPDRGTRSTS